MQPGAEVNSWFESSFGAGCEIDLWSFVHSNSVQPGIVPLCSDWVRNLRALLQGMRLRFTIILAGALEETPAILSKRSTCWGIVQSCAEVSRMPTWASTRWWRLSVLFFLFREQGAWMLSRQREAYSDLVWILSNLWKRRQCLRMTKPLTSLGKTGHIICTNAGDPQSSVGEKMISLMVVSQQ